LEFGLVYQSLSERQRLLGNAPHLVRTVPFVMPIYTKGGLIPKMVARLFGLVLWFYDVTGEARIGHRHRRLDRDETVRHMPVLQADRIHSGYLYHDAQVDDARMTMTIARTAALDHGAVVVNHAPVTALLKDATARCRARPSMPAGSPHRRACPCRGQRRDRGYGDALGVRSTGAGRTIPVCVASRRWRLLGGGLSVGRSGSRGLRRGSAPAP